MIVPSVTFLASANCARFVGAEVVFADVDPNTGLMGPHHLEEALGRVGGLRPRAVVPVHMAGQPADIVAIADVARRHRLHVVEDACHALGASTAEAHGEVPMGACRHSDMTVFSFHPVKTITSGEGGAITTRDVALAERLQCLRSHGIVRDADQFAYPDLAFDSELGANPWYYEMAELGFNYRLPDINCALGLSQLEKLAEFTRRRRALVDSYRRRVAPLAPLVVPLHQMPGRMAAWHLMVALVDFQAAGCSRAEVMARLRADGIGSQVHYIPVHLQPYYRHRYGDMRLPGAETYYQRCLSLPLFPAMTEDDVGRVVQSLENALGRRINSTKYT